MLFVDDALYDKLARMSDDTSSKICDRLQSLRQTEHDLSTRLGVSPPAILLSADRHLQRFGLFSPLENFVAQNDFHFDRTPNVNTAMTVDIRLLPGLEQLAFPSTVRSALQLTPAEERAIIAHELGHTLPDANSIYVPPSTSDNAAARTDAILHNHISEFRADRAILRAQESPQAFIRSTLKIVRHHREQLYERASKSHFEHFAASYLQERNLMNEDLARGMDTHPTIDNRSQMLSIPLEDEARWQQKLAEQRENALETERRTR